MHAAWHFWYAASFDGESGLRKVSLCGIHPLTQRYVYGVKVCHSLNIWDSKGQENFSQICLLEYRHLMITMTHSSYHLSF
ncbi:hypothetical protein CRN22_12875 [Vibrio vulnificus]|nr:hypothetical protein CRN22_12875 [Vibrio vulnificus]HAS8133711.1 DUF3265 domain-containing protein [Vibrio vulnificus]